MQTITALLVYATVSLSAAPPKLTLIWPTQVEALKDVRSLVEVELTREHPLRLVERSELDSIIDEQHTVLAGWTEEGRGFAVGRLQGADLVGLCLEDRLVCVGVRGFSDDVNISPPKVLFTFDPESGRCQPIAGSEAEAPGFPNPNVRHLEIVDLSPDPVREGLWATMLVNNRSKLFWYSAPENRWHELLDQFFDWHLDHQDRWLQPHPAGVLVGRHLYNAGTAQLRPVIDLIDRSNRKEPDGLGLIGPHVVYWRGACWGVTGGQRLARLGDGQPFEVGERLQSLDEVIVRLLPTPNALLVVTRRTTPEALSIWALDP